MATTKLKIKGDPPTTTPTPLEIQAANNFAKMFAIRRHLVSGQNTYVGNQLPQFVDESGKPYVARMGNIPQSMVQSIPPPYVKELQWDDHANLPYYIDEKSGDKQFVKKDWFFSDRFNPKRGKTNL